ncbi:MAG: ribonuclease HIII [Akkermansiaceae bacterium]
MALTSYTSELTLEQVTRLKEVLNHSGFEFGEKQYAIFSAKKGKLNVTAYEKGPKVLVQGKETEDFVRFVLEPQVLGEARLGYEEELNPEMFEPHFGVDESGKGDYFGPLVIAGVYTNRKEARKLMDAGIMDSKRVSSMNKINELSNSIREIVENKYKVVRWIPSKYNDLHDRYKNVNRMLAAGHAAVIHDLSRRVPSCPRSLSDQFARRLDVLESATRKYGVIIQIDQRTKAESDIAVAAASILARESFLDWMVKTSARCGVELPLGAGESVKIAARKFMQVIGKERLHDVAKIHFKTTSEL